MSLKDIIKKGIDKMNSLAVVKPTTPVNNSPTLIKRVYFKTAGVTFDNRQDVFKKFVKAAKKEYCFEPYDGMTNKEIIELDDSVFETSHLEINSLRLEPTEIKNKNAIEVHITDFYGKKEYLVGYVEKDEIDNVLEVIELIHNNPQYKVESKAYIVGGKVKKVVYDDDKPSIMIDELNYGLDVILAIYDK